MLKRFQLSSIFLFALACQGNDGDNGDEAGSCDPGTLNCECAEGQLCLGDLECNAGMCVAPEETGDPSDGDPTGDGDATGDGDGDPTTGDGDGDPTTGDGDGDTGDGDGDTEGCAPGLTECAGGCVDLMSDNNNCGECGTVCKITHDLGQCVDGQCGNVYSDCRDANADFAPCSEVCQDEGLACVAQGCDGGTYLWYTALDSCQGVLDNNGGADLGCDYPQSQSSNWYRCCCAQ